MNQLYVYYIHMGFPGGASGKEPTCQCRRHRTWVRSLGREDPLEQEMATHSSSLAGKIPWTEEPGELQSMGSQRVGRDWALGLSCHRLTLSCGMWDLVPWPRIESCPTAFGAWTQPLNHQGSPGHTFLKLSLSLKIILLENVISIGMPGIYTKLYSWNKGFYKHHFPSRKFNT